MRCIKLWLLCDATEYGSRVYEGNNRWFDMFKKQNSDKDSVSSCTTVISNARERNFYASCFFEFVSTITYVLFLIPIPHTF